MSNAHAVQVTASKHGSYQINIGRNIRLRETEGNSEEEDIGTYQGVHAEAPQSDHTYVCRGRTKVGRSCCKKTVGKFYCRYHDPLRIMAGDMETAFAAMRAEGGSASAVF